MQDKKRQTSNLYGWTKVTLQIRGPRAWVFAEGERQLVAEIIHIKPNQPIHDMIGSYTQLLVKCGPPDTILFKCSFDYSLNLQMQQSPLIQPNHSLSSISWKGAIYSYVIWEGLIDFLINELYIQWKASGHSGVQAMAVTYKKLVIWSDTSLTVPYMRWGCRSS